jgi:hypothetical protein
MFRWNSDTAYSMYAIVRNDLDSGILIMHRPLVWPVKFAFPSEFCLNFLDNPNLNYKSGPDMISAPQFFSYDTLAPGETRILSVIIHSMVFPREGSYRVKLRYTLRNSENSYETPYLTYDSNPFRIEFVK